MARALAHHLMRAVGLDITRHPHRQSFEYFLGLVLRHYSIRTVLDVGGNEGQFVQLLRETANWPGRVISFEPDPRTREVLERRARSDDLWTIRSEALTSESGILELFQYQDSTLNSLRNPSSYGKEKWHLEPQESVRVPARRLDEMRLKLPPPFFLKIDTQGHDLEVFRGATGVLDDVPALVMEIPVASLYDGAPEPAETLHTLAECGYRPAGMWPGHRVDESLALVDFDCVFVRSRAD